MKIFYSAKNNGFYHDSLLDDYDSSSAGWPDDAVDIDNDTYQTLLTAQSEGKVIKPDKDGMPILSEQEIDHIAEAYRKKKQLMASAIIAIAPYQDAYDLDIATKAEKSALIDLKKYRVALMRIDVTMAPKIEWPEIPKI